MNVKILAPGCANCQKLKQETVNALAELSVAADVEKVTALEKIMEHDVMILQDW